MTDAPFNYATHRRMHPVFHYGIFGAAVVNVIVSIVTAVRSFAAIRDLPAGVVNAPQLGFGAFLTVWNVAMALAFLGAVWFIRAYAAKVQDRVIRLEQTLRLQRILPADRHAQISRLTAGHFVALRFASDGEVAELVEFASGDPAPTPDAVKRRIGTWVRDDARI